MVTQAVGGAATRSISVVLSARDDGSVGRVFGRVSRELQGTADQLSEVRSEQRQLTRELRGVERGSDAYRDLERRIEDAKREAQRLTSEMEEQQRQWGRLTGRADQFGQVARASMAGVAVAAGALILTVNQVGERMTQALAITDETGLAIEDIQRLQNALQAVGRDLDANDLQEFAVRIGDAQQQMTEGVGPVFEALTRLGLPIRELGAKDLPLVIERLQQIPDAATRAFEADEILGGQLAESLRFYWALPDDVREGLEEVRVLTRAEAEELARAGAAAKAAGQELQQLGVAAVAGLLPALEGILEVVQPIVRGLGEFASANPALVQSLAALGSAVAGITTVLWAFNAAKAAALALSGPQGWAILGAAAGLLAVGGIAYGIGRGAAREREAEAQEQARQDRLSELFQPQGAAAAATRSGAAAGTRQGILDAAATVRQRQLAGILPGVSGEAPGAAASPAAPAPPERIPYTPPPDRLIRGVRGGLGANLEGAAAAGLHGTAGAAIIAQSYANAAQAEADAEFGRLQASQGALQQSGNLGLFALRRFREGAGAPTAGTDLNPAPVARPSPSGTAGPDYDPDAPARLAETINIYVQPRSDDAGATADAVSTAIQETQTAGRGQ